MKFGTLSDWEWHRVEDVCADVSQMTMEQAIDAEFRMLAITLDRPVNQLVQLVGNLLLDRDSDVDEAFASFMCRLEPDQDDPFAHFGSDTVIGHSDPNADTGMFDNIDGADDPKLRQPGYDTGSGYEDKPAKEDDDET